ncbi:hypothetical protein RHGRI_005086 [Rhododendron griersonianum]|uniref:Uncharacterized protein n=1 Tax=Rhododendron griersonianum TaxID=479676 RepID=A0AAV6LBZ4_9ERIC|nr:hypothetical protein RHGRI_005086 [Rhododendron griersonianum]
MGANSDLSGTQSSQVLSSLIQLTVDSDPSLHDYIKELEPFPDLGEFDGIQKFQQQLCQDYSLKEHLIKVYVRVDKANFHLDTGISEDLLVSLMRLLKKYLMDDSVKIIDMMSQTIQVHSKGVNMELVQNLLLDQERKFSAEAISLEKSTIWNTHEKNFETWICPLVYALIGYSDDIILRLCQDIVMLNAEVAELLLPNVVVNLAGRKNLDIDLCRIISLQIFYHLDMAWNLCWATSIGEKMKSNTEMWKLLSEPDVPTLDQHLLDSASTLRKGSRFSQAVAASHEFKFLCAGVGEQNCALYWLGRLEEAKLLRAQSQHKMAINLAKYISQNHQCSEVISNVYRLVRKWLAESRSSNSRTILEKYLKHVVIFAEDHTHTDSYVCSSRWLSSLTSLYPLVYQIASRMGSKDGHGPHSFQFSLASLVKKMAIDHPYHTIFQVLKSKLLALANGDRIKDKQRSRNSFVVDMDKNLAAENLLQELSSYHGAIIRHVILIRI